MKTWIGTVAVMVRDAAKAKRFYTQKLGLKVLEEMSHWVVVGQARRGSRIHLCEGPPEKGNTGIVLLADEPLDKAYRALKKKGVRFSVPPTPRPWGAECRLLDPDGNELWLAEG